MNGAAGIWGVLAGPLSIEEATLGGQLWGIAWMFGLVFLTSLPVRAALKGLVGLRVSADAEFEGMRVAECGIPAYPKFVNGSGVGHIGAAGGAPTPAVL